MIKNTLILFGLLTCITAQASTICVDTLTADFGSDQRVGCSPMTVKFFDSSLGDILEWEWEFPGGTPASSSDQNPVIQYNTVGLFDVRLTIRSADSIHTINQTDYISVFNSQPITSFSLETSGLTASFENESQFANDFVWDFGDGSYSIEASPQHTYAEEGTYIVRLKSTNSCGAVVQSDILIFGCCGGPVGYTANDTVQPYTQGFRPGSNLGYFPPWNDEQLADIAAGNPEYGVSGAGCKSVRPAQHESFLEQWGYDIRYETFNHYASLGLKDNTVIVGFPSDAHKDTTHHCSEYRSEMFANLYTDIWDNGENGTPVNDENHLALYLYKIVNLQKDKVKFWEIWNEPGFDFTFLTGYLPPGEDGNWWDNNPDPCDYKLRAPIFHYIRTMRISYEVIKAIDPDAYVTLASVGFTSFLDAILRNTDNPTDGSIAMGYPLQGGAYFDAIAIHSYPHFDGTLQRWDQATQQFIYSRHSDKAAGGIQMAKDTFQTILSQYGYDGINYPLKEWIITEINIPRKSFGDFIGSEEVQVNYIIKSYIAAVQNNIQQMHIFDMAESFELEDAINEFQVMGLYKRLFETFPYGERINNLGIAYKTASDLLFGSTYDIAKTAALQLPDSLAGAAFLGQDGYYTYVLWAKTTIDMSEEASAIYTFPSSLNISQLEQRNWDFSQTTSIDSINNNQINLSGTPIFLRDINNMILVPPIANFRIDSAYGCTPFNIQFQDQSSANTSDWFWSFEGGNPAHSTLANPTVAYSAPGIYNVSLRVSNGAGSDSIMISDIVVVDEALPTAAFDYLIFEKVVTFNNQSVNANEYFWLLGDGNSSIEPNPTHEYPLPGVYTVQLVSSNGCGTDTMKQIIIIQPNQTPPIPEFTANIQKGCAPLEVQFFDQSTANVSDWFWFFEGGQPQSSTEQNPVVMFEEPGSYFVYLIASNPAGGFQAYKDTFIVTDTLSFPIVNFSSQINSFEVGMQNLSLNASTYLWRFGDGSSSTDKDPAAYTYTSPGQYTITLIAENNCGIDSLTQTIAVGGAPLSNFSIDTTKGCAPLSVQFNDESQGIPNRWEWSFPGGSPDRSSDQNPVVVYSSPGLYSAELIVGNALGADTMLLNDLVEVQSLPTAAFDQSLNNESTIVLDNQSTQADSYSWDFGDGNSAMTPNPSHTYQQSGTYMIRLIASNSCGQDTSIQSVDIIITSIEDPSRFAALKIFPNPGSGLFTISAKGSITDQVNLEVLNILGQSIYREDLGDHWGTQLHLVDLQDQPEGSYLFKFSTQKEMKIIKVMIISH